MVRRVALALYAVAALIAACAGSAWAQGSQPRIIGGSEATITQYPYQVRVIITSGLVMESQCGGFIRDETHIVTAAHCVTDDFLVSRAPTSAANVSVRYGSADSATQTAAAVSGVSVTPQYLAGGSPSWWITTQLCATVWA